MLNTKTCIRLLMSRSNIRIVTHKNPDGDTIGSAGALCLALSRAGKNAWLVPNEGLPQKFLPYVEGLFGNADSVYDFTVSVDLADESLFPEGFSDSVDLCIDHHASNSLYAAENMILPDKAACGEIIAALIREMHGNITKDEADLLYIAISTDTGCFMYANTSPATFRCAARLIEAGADNFNINELMFRKVPVSRLKLEAMIYSGITVHKNGKVAVAVITRNMLSSVGVGDAELDDISSLIGRVENTEIGITIREQANGESKVSVRSSPSVDSSEICAVFGGGGHKSAAGCNIKATALDARDMLLAVIDVLYK